MTNENMEVGSEEPQAEGAAPVQEGEQLPPQPGQSLDSLNLLPTLEGSKEGKEFLEKYAKTMWSDYEEDARSMEGFVESCSSALELLYSKGGTMKDGPAEGSRRPCMPLLAKIWNRTTTSMMSVIENARPIAVSTEDGDEETSKLVTTHLEWEQRAKYAHWPISMAATAGQSTLYGQAFRYSCHDVLEGRQARVDVSPEKVKMPYTDNDRTPDLREIERYTIEWHYSKSKMLRLAAAGWLTHIDELFSDAEDAKKPTPAFKFQKPGSDALDEVRITQNGVEKSTKSSSVYLILERHSWEILPGEKLPRRFSAWMEASTRKLIRACIMETEDPVDLRRYQDEERRLVIKHENSLKQLEAKLADAEKAGAPPEVLAPLQQQLEQLSATPPPKPQQRPKTVAVYPLISFPFIPNPAGVYGLGLKDFVADLNETANDLAGEDIVGQRLANTVGGIVSEDIDGLDAGPIKVHHGKFFRVKTPDGSIADKIVPLPFERPKGNVMGWMDKLDQEAQTVMSSSDTQSGMPGPSHETARGATIRAQAGQSAMTAAAKRLLIPLTYEFKNYARLNATFLPEKELFFVNESDPENPVKTMRVKKEITRDMYNESYDITFSSDVQLETDPGIGQSAIDAYQLFSSDPEMAQFKQAKFYLFKKVLKAMKAGDVVAMLPDELPEPPPPEPMSQEDENAGFYEESDHPVLDDDDHLDHLAKMEEFEGTGQINELSPTGRQLFERHKRSHQARAYKQGTMLRDEAGAVEEQDAAEGLGALSGTGGDIPGLA